MYVLRRGVVPGGAGGAMAPPNFGRSANPISTKGDRLCQPNNIGTPRFSDLLTALQGNCEMCPIKYIYYYLFDIDKNFENQLLAYHKEATKVA